LFVCLFVCLFGRVAVWLHLANELLLGFHFTYSNDPNDQYNNSHAAQSFKRASN
jgi:hypothetical protein